MCQMRSDMAGSRAGVPIFTARASGSLTDISQPGARGLTSSSPFVFLFCCWTQNSDGGRLRSFYSATPIIVRIFPNNQSKRYGIVWAR